MRNVGLAILLTAAPVWSQLKAPLTIEDVLAAPRVPLAPNWSPGGGRFLTTNGTRLTVHEVSTGSRRELLDLKALDSLARMALPEAAFAWENRRVREQSVQWAPSGKEALVTRAGDLFMVDLATGKARQLTNSSARERDPKLSPDGKLLAYTLEHDLHVMDLAGRKTRAVTRGGTALVRNAELDWVYPEELALSTAYWWSPDSRRLAYLQFDASDVIEYPHGDLTQLRPVYEPERYPQAGTPNPKVRLGLVSAGGGATKWVALPELPSGTLIARVEWLNDSSSVAVALLNRVQNEVRWLRTDGKTEAVIYEQEDPAWINFRDDYRLLGQSASLLFGAERPNFRHLYLRPLNGAAGEPVAVTSGKWEVTDLNCVDEDARLIYYTSTEASPLERQLYRIAFDGSGKTRLTEGRGTHTVSMAPGCAAFTDTFSSITSPPRQTLHSSAGSKLLAEVSAPHDLLPTELTSFRGKDGAPFHARLLRPAGFDPAQKYPAIVQVYGGPHAQDVRDKWRGADYDQYLAQRGFVIWQMDNRGTAGRGHEWEAKLYRRFGQQELADQLEGVDHLISLGFVDAARIGINGWSYGGFMTLYSLLNAPGRFAAGIAGAPVTDWRQYDTIYTERYLGLPQQNEAGYKASSPVNQAARLQDKLMLVHNFEDDNVLFQHTLRMSDALQQAGKPFELMLYPQKTHAVTGAVRKHLLEATTSFWERHLQAPRKPQVR